MSDEASTETTVTPTPTKDEVPAEVLRKMLDETRQEAAETRVKAKEKVEKAKTEVTQVYEAKLAESNTSHESTKVKLAQAQLEVEKLTAAVNAGVESKQILAFAKLLQGSNADELKAHAEEVKSLFGAKNEPTPAVDPTAGSGNTVLPLNGDPLLRALNGIVNKGN